MNIKSKKNNKINLGIIFRNKKITNRRNNLCNENEYLQVSTQKLNKNFEIKPHIHLKLNRKTTITQETWIIIKGEIEVKIYDIDKSYIKKLILKKGDLFILLRGGHSMKVLTNNTEFYEIKNGPYFMDKKKDIMYLKKNLVLHLD